MVAAGGDEEKFDFVWGGRVGRAEPKSWDFNYLPRNKKLHKYIIGR